jgi:hypothetical protein
MSFVENEAALSQSGYAGVRHVDTTGLVTASFDHRMSRAGDVHIHTHTATLNWVRCMGREWRSLDGRALYRVAAAAGAIYDRVREVALERDLGVSHYTALQVMHPAKTDRNHKAYWFRTEDETRRGSRIH